MIIYYILKTGCYQTGVFAVLDCELQAIAVAKSFAKNDKDTYHVWSVHKASTTEFNVLAASNCEQYTVGKCIGHVDNQFNWISAE